MIDGFLKSGDCVGVMAPCSYVEQADIDAACAVLKSKSIQAFVHPQTFLQHHQSAGSREEKLDALHDLYSNPEVHAIWAAGGGNRAMDLLSGLDFDLIRAYPKPIIGFSDVTCLLNAVYARTGQVGLHCCNLKDLPRFPVSSPLSMDISKGQVLREGSVKGISIGGCLSLFHLLVGTPACTNLEGAVLFLEDTGDQISRFDRMFLDMKHKGALEKIGGLVIGEFHDLQDGKRPFGFSMQDIVLEAVGERDIPIIINAPFGHGANNHPFPIGGVADFDTNSKSIDFQL